MSFACVHIPNFLLQAVVRGDGLQQDFSSGVETPARNAGVTSELKLRPPEQSFAASCRAIAVVDRVPPLCRVVAANTEAWRAGVQMGMTKAEVEKFCTVEVRQRSHTQE